MAAYAVIAGEIEKENQVIKLTYFDENEINVLFDKNKIINLKNLSIKTYNNSKLNNDFSLSLGKKIKIKGSQFDATNLPKILNKKSKAFLEIGSSQAKKIINILITLE